MPDEGISDEIAEGATAEAAANDVNGPAAAVAVLDGVSTPSGQPRRTRLVKRLLQPPDQPAWARPILLLIAGLAGVAYGWGMARDSIETYYGAAARSMSENWHAFAFGAFDPQATITVDKLPGALWLQALSLHVFGFHIWAIVLPQVVEGVLTVLVLYRAVRRFAGPVAGLAAAAVVASSPVTVLLNRGNISDSLLILLLVLAADAVGRAVLNGHLRSLLLAGVWVGLAFQAKMLQAWLVLPAFALAYLLAAPTARLRTRTLHVAVATTVTAAVSFSWMTVVSLLPQGSRPFVDGSRTDSLFAQVFFYNGTARLPHGSTGLGSPAPFLVALARKGDVLTVATRHAQPSWHRLLSGPLGRDIAWLLPVAIVAAIAVIMAGRKKGRREPLRAAAVLWSAWLLVHAVVFSSALHVNSYYVAVLAPAIAALIGLGVSVALTSSPQRRDAVAAAGVAGSLGYAIYLIRGAAVVPAWVVPLVWAGLVATIVAFFVRRRLHRVGPQVVVVSCALLLIAPLAASVAVVNRGLGPFDVPFESSDASAITQALSNRLSLIEQDESRIRLPRDRVALVVDTSGLAAAQILFTGNEVLPIGGYTGAVPSPTLDEIKRGALDERLSYFELPIDPPSDDPRLTWVETNCHKISDNRSANGITYGLYDCRPDD